MQNNLISEFTNKSFKQGYVTRAEAVIIALETISKTKLVLFSAYNL